MWSTAKTRLSRLVAAPQVTFLHIVVEGYWTVAPPITQNIQTITMHICATCGRAFTRRANLQRHASSCRPNPFVCDVCRRSFTRERDLDRHKRNVQCGAPPQPGPAPKRRRITASLDEYPLLLHRPEKCMINSRVICKNICLRNGRLYGHTWSTAQSRHVITGGLRA